MDRLNDPFGPLREVIRTELQECLGILPRGQQGALASPIQAGASNSGTTGKRLVSDLNRVMVLQVNAPQVIQNGCNGLATVHVTVFPGDVLPEGEERANGMLLLDVEWQSGLATGKETVDITKGAMFSLGGVNAINAYARFASNVLGEPLVVYETKRVEANVHWRTSINPVKAMLTLPSVTLEADEASEWYRIPVHAEHMLAWGDTPGGFATLTAEFANADTAAAIFARTLDPFRNGSWIVHGAEFVRFISPTPQTVFPVFELHI